MNDVRRVRPVNITFLSIFVLCFTAWNGLRLSEAIYYWRTLAEFDAYPLYISISGGAWLIVGLFLVWSMWLGKFWGRIATLSAAASYTLWYWFDRSVLQEIHTNWPFVLVVNMIFLLFMITILFSYKARLFFTRDAYEC
jgi:hypothetical protein